MLTAEENRLISQTGPGTPMGELFRRFWIPVMLSEEIPARDCPPARLRILGEDLISFRDSDGRVGILDAYCPHRGAPLFFGRNEDSGLRCVYHGWKFDVEGACVDIPNSSEGEGYKDKVQITRYPAVDKGGMIWAYMGPPERQPPLPAFDFMGLPANHFAAWKIVSDCNYLQSLEGAIDASHGSFLHSNLDNSSPRARVLGMPQMRNRAVPYYGFVEETEYGVIGATVRPTDDGDNQVGISQLILPSFVPGTGGGNLSYIRARIPIDDETSAVFRVWWDTKEPLSSEYLQEMRSGEFFVPEMMPGTYRPKASRSNDYGIDRHMQKNYNFTGIKEFNMQDVAVIEDQRGAIMDRTREHLLRSDLMIISMRKALIKAARDLASGQEPALPHKSELFNVKTAQFRLPKDASVEEATRERIGLLTAPAIAAG